MARFDESFDRRETARVACRLDCALLAAGERHEGVLQDLSPSVLRVRAAGDLRPGAAVVVSLQAPEGELFVLDARVREHRPVARSLAAACGDVLVLDLREPPPSWLRFVEDEARKAS